MNLSRLKPPTEMYCAMPPDTKVQSVLTGIPGVFEHRAQLPGVLVHRQTAQ